VRAGFRDQDIRTVEGLVVEWCDSAVGGQRKRIKQRQRDTNGGNITAKFKEWRTTMRKGEREYSTAKKNTVFVFWFVG